MLAHDFQDMPGRSTEIGDNPHEPVMLLKCTWCKKSPSKAREDGCPVHELKEKGSILLSDYNPDGVAYFKGRKCVTCENLIMEHWLVYPDPLLGGAYWCDSFGRQACEGITDCQFDVEGVVVPQEPCQPQ